eukprot:2695227-Pleurochrysis_carterae.AAC.2
MSSTDVAAAKLAAESVSSGGSAYTNCNLSVGSMSQQAEQQLPKVASPRSAAVATGTSPAAATAGINSSVMFLGDANTSHKGV